MTTRYQKERQNGKDKKEAISIAHKTSMPSIISSGLSFFAATFGVACYSQVEMIGSICTLLARGRDHQYGRCYPDSAGNVYDFR